MSTDVSDKLVNLLDFDKQSMADYFTDIGEKPFRASQLIQWIHQFGLQDFNEMSNLSKDLRNKLNENCQIKPPEVAFDSTSNDGTRKWLLRLDCGNCIETVFIPEKERGTLCVSSQVGCSLNCTFCSTAEHGYNRNLKVSEIIGQVWVASRLLSEDGSIKNNRPITNVVMMGMGEPLLNFDNVVKAMNIMQDDFAYGISKHRLTLSTSGVVPYIDKLAEVSDVALAISLHAPNDELRTQIVPINKKYPLEMLIAACKNYFKDQPKRHITIEYVMLNGINDHIKHAKQLIRLLEGLRVKVNLIPFNPFPGSPYTCSPKETIDAFRSKLISSGLNTTTRKTRGEDIDAACGQLAGQFYNKTNRKIKRIIPIEQGQFNNDDKKQA